MDYFNEAEIEKSTSYKLPWSLHSANVFNHIISSIWIELILKYLFLFVSSDLIIIEYRDIASKEWNWGRMKSKNNRKILFCSQSNKSLKLYAMSRYSEKHSQSKCTTCMDIWNGYINASSVDDEWLLVPQDFIECYSQNKWWSWINQYLRQLFNKCDRPTPLCELDDKLTLKKLHSNTFFFYTEFRWDETRIVTNRIKGGERESENGEYNRT